MFRYFLFTDTHKKPEEMQEINQKIMCTLRNICLECEITELNSMEIKYLVSLYSTWETKNC